MKYLFILIFILEDHLSLKYVSLKYFVTRRKFFLKIYSQNIVVIQYNILKIFTMHFNKINQIYFVFYWNFLNE